MGLFLDNPLHFSNLILHLDWQALEEWGIQRIASTYSSKCYVLGCIWGQEICISQDKLLILRAKNPVRRVWKTFLKEYDACSRYCKGQYNIVVDAPSRMPEINSLAFVEIKSDSLNSIWRIIIWARQKIFQSVEPCHKEGSFSYE